MTYTIVILVTHRPWAFFSFTLTQNPSTSRSRRAAAGRYIYIYVEEKGVSLQKGQSKVLKSSSRLFRSLRRCFSNMFRVGSVRPGHGVDRGPGAVDAQRDAMYKGTPSMRPTWSPWRSILHSDHDCETSVTRAYHVYRGICYPARHSVNTKL